MKKYQGKLTAENLKFGIVVSRFNDFITKKLLDGCIDSLVRHGTDPENINIAWVPGGFEIPLATKKMAEKRYYDAIICLGCIIQGSTPHFKFIAGETSKGIAKISQDYNTPVSMGILTTDSIEQAIERAGTKHGNKGEEAALAAIEMANLMQVI
jgi:6,7-dimethyl-8-ribityllumazine synthase